MILLAIALAAQPAAPVATPARALQPLQSYWRAGDYPRDAVRMRRQGRVSLELTIGPNGRAAACRVTASSGTSSLDAATCRIVLSRARFEPARDAAGNPTIGRIGAMIAWILPSRG